MVTFEHIPALHSMPYPRKIGYLNITQLSYAVPLKRVDQIMNALNKEN